MSAGFQGYKSFFRPNPQTKEYLWKYGTRTHFPNIKLGVMRGKNNQESVAFKTDPKLTKFEIKQFLTSVYGLNVSKINTLNYEPALGHHHAPGPARIGKWYKKRKGYKKAYVKLSDTKVNSIVHKMKEHAEDLKTIQQYYEENPPTEYTNEEDNQEENDEIKKE